MSFQIYRRECETLGYLKHVLTFNLKREPTRAHRTSVVFRFMTKTHSFTLLDSGTQLWFILRSLPYQSVHGRNLLKLVKTRDCTKRLVAGSDAGLTLTDTQHMPFDMSSPGRACVNDVQALLTETCWLITALGYDL